MILKGNLDIFNIYWNMVAVVGSHLLNHCNILPNNRMSIGSIGENMRVTVYCVETEREFHKIVIEQEKYMKDKPAQQRKQNMQSAGLSKVYTKRIGTKY